MYLNNFIFREIVYLTGDPIKAYKHLNKRSKVNSDIQTEEVVLTPKWKAVVNVGLILTMKTTVPFLISH